MSGGNWTIYLCDPTGVRVRLLDNIASANIGIMANDVGTCAITLPGDFDKTLIRKDGLLEFWRRPLNGVHKLFNTYFIRGKSYLQNADGQKSYAILGADGNYLLSSRIVPYAANSAQAFMTGAADDLCKAIVKDALGTDAAAGRDISAVAGGFTIQADYALGATISKAFAYRNLLEVLREICEASDAGGTKLYFRMVPSFSSTSLIQWKFRTYTAQIGNDRTWGTGIPVMFGAELGNMADGDYTEDSFNELNYIYVGGPGEDAARTLTAVSAATIYDSIWNRREGFKDARNAFDNAGLMDTNAMIAAGRAEYKSNRVVKKFSGTLLDTEQFRYGVDWEFGDLVTCSHFGMQFDGMIKAVVFDIDGDGQEHLTARVESEE